MAGKEDSLRREPTIFLLVLIFCIWPRVSYRSPIVLLLCSARKVAIANPPRSSVYRLLSCEDSFHSILINHARDWQCVTLLIRTFTCYQLYPPVHSWSWPTHWQRRHPSTQLYISLCTWRVCHGSLCEFLDPSTWLDRFHLLVLRCSTGVIGKAHISIWWS